MKPNLLIGLMALALPLGTNSLPGGYNVKDSPVCDDVKNKMKNIGYILSGYDLWYGNPMAVERTVDPGFRGQIFAAHYGDTLTADNRYCVPDNMFLKRCGSCNFHFQKDEFTGSKNYTKRLDVHIGVDLSSKGAITGHFGASFDYNRIHQQTTYGQNVFTQAETSCCAYTSDIVTTSPPQFHPNFTSALKGLTEEYNEDVYSTFVYNYGTHFVTRSIMGAIYGQQTMFSYKAYTEMEKDGINVKVYAGFDAMKKSNITPVDPSSASITYNNTMHEKWTSLSTESYTIAFGTTPTSANNDPETWERLVIDEPIPTDLELVSITKLPIQNIVSATVISNLEQHLEGYCAKLLAQGKLSSCTPPGDDPPLPEIRSWTEWSNDHSAHWSVEYPAQQCPQGHYITDFSWLQYEHGFKDVKIKCSGMDWYKPPVGSKVHHDDFWTEPQTCSDKGFSSVTGREYDHVWWGIVNAKTQCIDSALEVEAGKMEYGEWNDKLGCKPNERLVGFHVRQDHTYVKLVNFRAQCGTIPN